MGHNSSFAAPQEPTRKYSSRHNLHCWRPLGGWVLPRWSRFARRLYPVRRLTREERGGVVALIARRVERLLERRGLAGGAESERGAGPVVGGGAGARRSGGRSVDGRVAIGPRAGARVRRCGDPPEDVAPMTLGPCHAHVDGFDLHAGLVTRAGQRDRLERLCRYALRPPLAQDRLHVSAEGRSGSRCGTAGRTGRRTCGSIRWSCWSGSPC